MPKLTLEEIVNLPPDAILKRIINKTPDHFVEVTASVSAEAATSVDNGADENVFSTSLLKNYFMPNHVFNLHDVFKVGKFNVQVIGTIKSANRIKFRVIETGGIHSVSVSDLTGQKSDFPFKKGDRVDINGEVYEVKRINPANNNIVIFKEGQFRYIKASKVSLIT
jgi:hypothetical protein